MNTRISVITICFNNLQELMETCRSVDQQTVLPDEHLIIDGSTNEEILNWLLHHPQPAYRHAVHEKDKGISDAFNKGITYANANERLTHLLNAGDRYADSRAIGTVLSHFDADPKLMWLHGRYIQHRGDMDVISGAAFEKSKLWKGMRMVAHPSMFIRKEVYDRCGTYSLEYKIAMDYDMLIRMRNEKFKFIPDVLVYFAPGGASDQQFKRGLSEVKQIYRTRLGYSFRQDLWQLRQGALQFFMQTGVGKKWFQWKNKRDQSVII